MKKTLSTLLVCVLLLGCVFSLAGCVCSLGSMTMITGKYEANLVAAEVVYDFGAFGGVTVTVDPIIGNSISFEGKYKVDKDADEITFTFEDEDAKEYSGTFQFATGEENGTKYVEVGYVKYMKVD